jgi:hypothetical protein
MAARELWPLARECVDLAPVAGRVLELSYVTSVRVEQV